VSSGFAVGRKETTKHLATIASIYTMVVSAAAAEAVDLSYKVRPRALFAIAWSKLYCQTVVAVKLKLESNTYK